MDGEFTYEIKEADKLCIVTGKGAISFESSVEAMHTLADMPGFNPDYNIIVDLRAISYHPNYKEFFGIKNNLVSMKDHFRKKIAIVATGFLMAMAELMGKLSGMKGMHVSAFSDFDNAMRWISEEH